MLHGLCDLAPLREIVLIFSQLLRLGCVRSPLLGLKKLAGDGVSTYEKMSDQHSSIDEARQFCGQSISSISMAYRWHGLAPNHPKELDNARTRLVNAPCAIMGDVLVRAER